MMKPKYDNILKSLVFITLILESAKWYCPVGVIWIIEFIEIYGMVFIYRAMLEEVRRVLFLRFD
jgi:hypothetical protein